MQNPDPMQPVPITVDAEQAALPPENCSCRRELIPVASIICDPGIQPRAQLHEATVTAYADLIREGDTTFPPVVVFHEPGTGTLRLVDGFHRVEATRQAGENIVLADIRDGTREEAIFHACGANSRHGLRLTNADKRRVVKSVLDLEDRKPKEQRLSQRDIAKHCGVTQPFVRTLVRERARDNGYHPATPETIPVTVTYRETASVMAQGEDVQGDVSLGAHIRRPEAAVADSTGILAHPLALVHEESVPVIAQEPSITEAIVTHVMEYLRHLTDVPVALLAQHFREAAAEIEGQIRRLAHRSP